MSEDKIESTSAQSAPMADQKDSISKGKNPAPAANEVASDEDNSDSERASDSQFIIY